MTPETGIASLNTVTLVFVLSNISSIKSPVNVNANLKIAGQATTSTLKHVFASAYQHRAIKKNTGTLQLVNALSTKSNANLGSSTILSLAHADTAAVLKCPEKTTGIPETKTAAIVFQENANRLIIFTIFTKWCSTQKLACASVLHCYVL